MEEGRSEGKEMLFLLQHENQRGETQELSSSSSAETTPSGGIALLLVLFACRVFVHICGSVNLWMHV